MAVPASFEPRVVCPRCRRPASACYCSRLTAIDTVTRVVLLQHPRERGKAIGTAHMASLCLRNAELHVGAEWTGSSLLAALRADTERPAMLLYPGEGAVDPLRTPLTRPITLVVVDGTWAHTKKMVKRCPELAALPRLAFLPPRPSEYRIRREPHEACVSTVEALAHVLGALEGDASRFEALLDPFRFMVDTQIACRDRIHAGRTRRRRPPRGPDPRLACLTDRAGDLVCVAGEANAWPYGSSEREDVRLRDELVHWVAYRPATGEVFDQVIAPRNPLAPSTPQHIGLTEGALRGGASSREFLEAWRGFVRDRSVLAAWGSYAVALLLGEGGLLPEGRVDIRHAARDTLKRRVGTVEAFLENAGVALTPALASGRAGRRLERLVRAVELLKRLSSVGADPSSPAEASSDADAAPSAAAAGSSAAAEDLRWVSERPRAPELSR